MCSWDFFEFCRNRSLPALLSARTALIVSGSIAAGVVCGAPMAPASGQQVRGTLVEHPAEAPIPGGVVQLLDSTGAVVDSTRSSRNGSFVVRARKAGSYTLYFSSPGYATVPSEPLHLRSGQSIEHRFRVPLISGVALRRMAEVIDIEKRLQSDLAELCGEPLRPTEAGIVVGVVRRRPGNQPIAGAVVQIEAAGRDSVPRFHRATVSSANGVYVVCNVPGGEATMRTEVAGYRIDEGPIVIRAGDVAWYDVLLRRRR